MRADFVRRVLRRPSSSRTQVALEEELGAGIPTVFKGNIVYIICDAVRIWRDHDNGVLLTPQPLSTVKTMQILVVYTSIYQYILEHTNIY